MNFAWCNNNNPNPVTRAHLPCPAPPSLPPRPPSLHGGTVVICNHFKNVVVLISTEAVNVVWAAESSFMKERKLQIECGGPRYFREAMSNRRREGKTLRFCVCVFLWERTNLLLMNMFKSLPGKNQSQIIFMSHYWLNMSFREEVNSDQTVWFRFLWSSNLVLVCSSLQFLNQWQKLSNVFIKYLRNRLYYYGYTLIFIFTFEVEVHFSPSLFKILKRIVQFRILQHIWQMSFIFQ